MVHSLYFSCFFPFLHYFSFGKLFLPDMKKMAKINPKMVKIQLFHQWCQKYATWNKIHKIKKFLRSSWPAEAFRIGPELNYSVVGDGLGLWPTVVDRRPTAEFVNTAEIGCKEENESFSRGYPQLIYIVDGCMCLHTRTPAIRSRAIWKGPEFFGRVAPKNSIILNNLIQPKSRSVPLKIPLKESCFSNLNIGSMWTCWDIGDTFFWVWIFGATWFIYFYVVWDATVFLWLCYNGFCILIWLSLLWLDFGCRFFTVVRALAK